MVKGSEYNLVDGNELTPIASASRAVKAVRVGDPPLNVRVLAAITELQTTLRKMPLWIVKRLEGGDIRVNWKLILKDMREQEESVGVVDGGNWMFESEEDEEEDDDEDGRPQRVMMKLQRLGSLCYSKDDGYLDMSNEIVRHE